MKLYRKRTDVKSLRKILIERNCRILKTLFLFCLILIEISPFVLISLFKYHTNHVFTLDNERKVPTNTYTYHSLFSVCCVCVFVQM